MDYGAEEIKEWCEQEWDKWKADCSGFVRAVCAHAGANLHGQANYLIDFFEASNFWESLGDNPKVAIAQANVGCLVVGGLKARPNGHVVIVVSSHSSMHPVAYWGRLGAVGRKNAGVNWSWNRSDLSKVQYYGFKL